jgi:hypothetical protein
MGHARILRSAGQGRATNRHKANQISSPRAADKIYDKLVEGPKGERIRTAEKLTVLARKAWKVVQRLYPSEFNKDVPNPWIGVTMKTRVKQTKAAVTRDQVYEFANGCIHAGAAIAVICFEWLQRPENVIAGHINRITATRRRRPSSGSNITRQRRSFCIRSKKNCQMAQRSSSMRKLRPCCRT